MPPDESPSEPIRGGKTPSTTPCRAMICPIVQNQVVECFSGTWFQGQRSANADLGTNRQTIRRSCFKAHRTGQCTYSPTRKRGEQIEPGIDFVGKILVVLIDPSSILR
jgi:hypothetical protein